MREIYSKAEGIETGITYSRARVPVERLTPKLVKEFPEDHHKFVETLLEKSGVNEPISIKTEKVWHK